ncbi:MAG TPA: hypothetical protein VK540_12345 [Polyangiaceae bacterium]|nr:hypothetical protein [Polyangiaceae bacterium]
MRIPAPPPRSSHFTRTSQKAFPFAGCARRVRSARVGALGVPNGALGSRPWISEIQQGFWPIQLARSALAMLRARRQ